MPSRPAPDAGPSRRRAAMHMRRWYRFSARTTVRSRSPSTRWWAWRSTTAGRHGAGPLQLRAGHDHAQILTRAGITRRTRSPPALVRIPQRGHQGYGLRSARPGRRRPDRPGHGRRRGQHHLHRRRRRPPARILPAKPPV